MTALFIALLTALRATIRSRLELARARGSWSAIAC
jgi:hypothetical protein